MHWQILMSKNRPTSFPPGSFTASTAQSSWGQTQRTPIPSIARLKKQPTMTSPYKTSTSTLPHNSAITIRSNEIQFRRGTSQGLADPRPNGIGRQPYGNFFGDQKRQQKVSPPAPLPKSADGRKKSSPPKDTSKKAIVESFQIHAKGHPDDFTSFEGKGSLRLQDPDLAKVNMLSLLSRELTGLTLPLISYKFNKMETGFVLKDKHLVVDPTLLISGSSAKVEAKGKINLTNNKLDFRVKLLPLGIPPGGILEMRLRGNLDNPAWNPSVLPPGIKRKGIEGYVLKFNDQGIKFLT